MGRQNWRPPPPKVISYYLGGGGRGERRESRPSHRLECWGRGGVLRRVNTPSLTRLHLEVVPDPDPDPDPDLPRNNKLARPGEAEQRRFDRHALHTAAGEFYFLFENLLLYHQRDCTVASEWRSWLAIPYHSRPHLVHIRANLKSSETESIKNICSRE